MKCINLNEETVKILGIHFSYNKKLEEDKNFNNHIANRKCFNSMEDERLHN